VIDIDGGNMSFEPAGLFARTEGQAGAAVVCLHSSTGSHAQWRGLASQLARHCRVTSFDLHGHGRSPDWPDGSETAGRTLLVDAQAVIARMHAEPGIHLVAHSYGAAVAMQIALRHPKWVRSLALYEPVAFGMIRRLAPGDAALREIEAVAAAVRERVARGELADAAALFVGYWGGAGAWRDLDAAQQAVVMSRIGSVPNHFDATFAATWGRETLARLTMPTLLMHGSETRASARRVAELLGVLLPQVQCRRIDGAGHLGPMTHDALVNREIAAHLDRHAPSANAFGAIPQLALT
jgi:pimeloyl-ACP methyl ester carboxylesterase